jgi:hypothetical protein
LLPLIKGEKQVHRQAVFSEGGRLHGEFQAMEDGPTLRDPNFLYWPRLSWQQAEGPEHTKAVMCRTQKYKYVRRLYEQDELYDLELDPHELINRIADPEYAAIRMQMIETMLTFMVETADTVPHDYDQRS